MTTENTSVCFSYLSQKLCNLAKKSREASLKSIGRVSFEFFVSSVAHLVKEVFSKCVGFRTFRCGEVCGPSTF